MKKSFLLAFCALGLTFALSSCSKEHTCTCVTSDSSGLIDDVTTTVTYEGKKGDAEDACAAAESTLGTITTTCSLD